VPALAHQFLFCLRFDFVFRREPATASPFLLIEHAVPAFLNIEGARVRREDDPAAFLRGKGTEGLVDGRRLAVRVVGKHKECGIHLSLYKHPRKLLEPVVYPLIDRLCFSPLRSASILILQKIEAVVTCILDLAHFSLRLRRSKQCASYRFYSLSYFW
jgi:hypothetical protein